MVSQRNTILDDDILFKRFAKLPLLIQTKKNKKTTTFKVVIHILWVPLNWHNKRKGRCHVSGILLEKQRIDKHLTKIGV